MEEEEEEERDSQTQIEEEASEIHATAQNGKRHCVEDQHVLQFLDSTDDYLTQMDSLSIILRQVNKIKIPFFP